MRKGQSKRSTRHPLQPLSANELNKTNRNNRTQHNYIRYDTQSLNKASKRLNIEVIDHNNDSMNEPPKKKRKSNQRLILSPIPISDHKRRYGSPIPSLTTTSVITNKGNIGNLRHQNRMNINVDDISINFRLNNQELTKSIIKYKETYKSLQEKCKIFQHENKTFKQMIKIFNDNDKNLKKQRQIDQDKIANLEEKIENITNELNKNLKPDNYDQLNHKINEYQYECKKWKSKYHKLQNQNDEVYNIYFYFGCYIFLFLINKFILIDKDKTK